MKIHIMGVLGMGAYNIAIMARRKGFEVSGCDSGKNLYIEEKLKKYGVSVFHNHNKIHVREADIVLVSSAIPNYLDEYTMAQEEKKLMSWQEFSASFLQEGKKVIAVCGTHGKTTTTLAIGHIMNANGKKCMIQAGGVEKENKEKNIETNVEYFICEADEYKNQFLFYKPSVIVLNNISLEHVDYFKNIEEVQKAFFSFCTNLIHEKRLILNMGNRGVRNFWKKYKNELLNRNINVIHYLKYKLCFQSIVNRLNKIDTYVWGSVEKHDENSMFFLRKTGGKKRVIRTKLNGEFNMENCVSSYLVSLYEEISEERIATALTSFLGVRERFDCIVKKNSFRIYLDYGHHPDEIEATIKMIKSYFPKWKIWVVFEPYTKSRTKKFYKDFAQIFNEIYRITVLKVDPGREQNLKIADIGEVEWKSEIYNSKFDYVEEKEQVLSLIDLYMESNMIVIFFGEFMNMQREIQNKFA